MRKLRYLLASLVFSIAIFLSPLIVNAQGKYSDLLEKYPYNETGQGTNWWSTEQETYPWANEPLNAIGDLLGPAGCGVTSITIQAQRSGITKLKNGDELNPGNLAIQVRNHPNMLNIWVAKPDSIASLFNDGDYQYVTSSDPVFVGSWQGGYQQFGGGTSNKQKVKAIKDMIDKGYYPVGLLTAPGHFIAIHDANVEKVELTLNDSARAGKTATESGGTSFPLTSYNLSQLNSVGFLKFKTPIGEANGSSKKEDETKEKEEDLEIKKGGGGVTEDDITGMPKERDYEDQNKIEEADPLEGDEGEQLALWKEDYDRGKEIDSVRLGRTLVAGVGILLITYSVFLITAYMYDVSKVHGGSLLQSITLGRLVVAYDGKSTFKDKDASPKQITWGNLIFIIFVLIFVASLFLTGSVFTIIDFLIEAIKWVVDFFKGIQKDFNF